MSKAIEEKKNRKLRSKDAYDISIYIGNLCVQTKVMIKTKQNFFPLPLQLQFS